VYILNQSPTKAVSNQTPYEAWFKRKPKVEHFRIFSCIAYAHIPKENREKLDEKGEKCIFIGYSNESKGYRRYKPESKKLIISRNAIFDEDAQWSWQDNSTQHPPSQNLSPTLSQEGGHTQTPEPNSPPTSSPHSPKNTPITTPIPNLPQPTHRSQRDRHPPTYLQDYQCGHTITAFFASEPQSSEEAAQDEKWIEAMDQEIKMIEKNDTWELTDKPEDKDIIGLKWVYKIKYNEDGSIQKYKARLVAKGYSQQPGSTSMRRLPQLFAWRPLERFLPSQHN